MADQIMLYGDIGSDWWTGDGITEEHVLEGLKSLDMEAPKHQVRINSPGGRVDTGLAIFNLLRHHKAQMKAINPAFQLETIVDGYAMSVASVIFMSGDKRIVCLGGIGMIHDAWCGMYGNAAEMTKAANRLDMLSENSADIYAKCCVPAADKEPVRDSMYYRGLMKEETYFIGEGMVKCGLATDYDSGLEAQMHTDLTPEKLKGHYTEMMTAHYKKRTYNKATAANSIANVAAAKSRLALMLATV